MTRTPKIVAYLAHPVGAPTAEGVAANVARAKRWLAYLQKRYPDRAFIAPYITAIDSGIDDDHDPVSRAAGLERMCAVVERCQEFWIVGCGPSGECTVGMAAEYAVAMEAPGVEAVMGEFRYLTDVPTTHDEPPTAADVVNERRPCPRCGAMWMTLAVNVRPDVCFRCGWEPAETLSVHGTRDEAITAAVADLVLTAHREGCQYDGETGTPCSCTPETYQPKGEA